MAFDIPASVPVEGTRRVYWLAGGAADPDAVSVAALSSAVLVGCYVTGNGWTPGGDQATVQDRRLCSSADFEQPGRETNTLDTMYTFNLEEPDADEARLALVKGSKGAFINVLQKPEDDENVATGDWYEYWPVTTGVQRVMAPEDNAVDRIQQKQFVTGPVRRFKQLVA